MTLYLLSVYQPDGEPPPPEVLQNVMRDVHNVRRDLQAAGAWVFAGGLHASSTATVLRPHKGEVLMTDGPFVEGKEHLGGVSIIKAPDLDAALEWGRKLARATTLPIEVRPFRGEDCRLLMSVTTREIERVFREEYGRAVAVLVRSFGDIDLAQDAVQDAFARRWNDGPATDYHPVQRVGSSRLRATGPSIGCVARGRARSGMRRPHCCMAARSRRTRSRWTTTACG